MEVVSSMTSCSPPSPTKSPVHSKRSRRNTTSSPPSSSLLARRSSRPDLLNSLLNLSSPPSPSSTPSLSRASSALSLLYSSQSQPHSPGESASSPHASPIVSTSNATATGTVRAPRKAPGAALPLPFVPLTPIMASPRLTPEISASRKEDRGRRNWELMVDEQDPGTEGVTEEEAAPGQPDDYLTRGGQMAMPSLTVASTESGCESSAPPTPTWTSTPPTPPPKLSSEPSPVRSPARSMSKSRSRSARPASVAVVPLSRSSSSPSRARPTASLPSSSSLASTSTATSTATVRGRHSTVQLADEDSFRDSDPPRRRMSLPPNLSKALPTPPTPGRTTGTASSSPARQTASRLHERTASPLRTSVLASEGRVSKKGSARKLFTLDGDTEGSDAEEERERSRQAREMRRTASVGSGQNLSRERSRHSQRRDSEAEEREREAERERRREEEREEVRRAALVSEAEVERLRMATRRYHALMELLATEVGYLMDLRALVTVYLEQLPTLSAASHSSSSPALSLGLARSLPSSRSAFLHTSPAPSPSVSASSHLGVGADPGHGPPTEKEKTKEAKREKSRERARGKDKGKDKAREGVKDSKDKDKGRDGGKKRDKEREPDAAMDDDPEREKENVSVVGHRHEPQEHKGFKDESHPSVLPHSHSYVKSKHVRRPILADKDVRAVCRNADELLQFHDQFVHELREVVGGYGLRGAFALSERRDEGKVAHSETMEPMVLDRIDEVVSVVAEKFVNQAPSFSIYEKFCPGHNQAVDLIRNVQESYPVEWDAYEQRCSLLISHAFDFNASSGASSEDPVAAGLPSSATAITTPMVAIAESPRKKRRHSTSSLTMLSGLSSGDLTPHAMAAMRAGTTEPERKREGSSSSTGAAHKSTQSQATRLKFLDYLIKPVQRICRYPLLLDQLRTKRARTQSVQNASAQLPSEMSVGTYSGEIGVDTVQRAGEAMRVVVSLVDRASEVQAHIVRSALIASRLVFTHPIVASSNHGHSHSASSSSGPTSPLGREQVLTPEFVASLGPCQLAGALDVVHHPSAVHATGSGTLRARYLGAFLYMGGYVVLVKIAKSGKIYEPRYWFSLAGFDLLDLEDDDISLPFSFHLCGHGHHLQFAAACHPEKIIWINAINDVVAMAPRWTNEPVSSLRIDDKPYGPSVIDDTLSDWNASPLPTIQSLNEIDGQADGQSPEVSVPSKAHPDIQSKALSRLETTTMRQEQYSQASSFAALSRRSSTASVKAFFSPMTLDPSTRIARPSTQVRQHVNQGLHDVFSEQCLAARSQALMREEELYQVRKRPGGGMSRSNSGLSITGAMSLAAKRRYDNMLVSRRKGSLDGDRPSDMEVSGKHLTTLSGRAKSLTSRRRKKPLPSVVPAVASSLSKVESEAEADIPTTQSPVGLLDSPFPPSQCSSTTSSNLPSPVDLVDPDFRDLAPDATIRQSDMLLAAGGEDFRPKRARSMVDNVRHFFHSRPASPSSSSGHHSPTPPPPPVVSPEPEPEPEPEPQTGFVQWWRKGSLRRRVQSSPDMPAEDSQPVTLGRASEDNRGTFLVPISPAVSREHLSTPSPNTRGHSPATSRRVAFNDSLPSRRRSLFAPVTRQFTPQQTGPEAGPAVPRKSLRNVWFFQRSNSFTPMDMKPSNA